MLEGGSVICATPQCRTQVDNACSFERHNAHPHSLGRKLTPVTFWQAMGCRLCQVKPETAQVLWQQCINSLRTSELPKRKVQLPSCRPDFLQLTLKQQL